MVGIFFDNVFEEVFDKVDVFCYGVGFFCFFL